jgi:hypothetical protein
MFALLRLLAVSSLLLALAVPAASQCERGMQIAALDSISYMCSVCLTRRCCAGRQAVQHGDCSSQSGSFTASTGYSLHGSAQQYLLKPHAVFILLCCLQLPCCLGMHHRLAAESAGRPASWPHPIPQPTNHLTLLLVCGLFDVHSMS